MQYSTNGQPSMWSLSEFQWLLDTDKLILKPMQDENEESTVIMKRTVWEPPLPDFKTHFKAPIIKAVTLEEGHMGRSRKQSWGFSWSGSADLLPQHLWGHPLFNKSEDSLDTASKTRNKTKAKISEINQHIPTFLLVSARVLRPLNDKQAVRVHVRVSVWWESVDCPTHK